MGADAAQKGIDNLRATAKWLLQVYAPIGALLLAGTPFTGIGRLQPTDQRLWLAIVCGLIALVAVATIVLLASRVLTTDATTIADVRNLPDTSAEAQLLYHSGLVADHAALVNLQVNDAITVRILMIVAFERYRQRFVRLQWAAGIGSVFAAVAIAGFVWAANAPLQQPIAYTLLQQADVQLTDAARRQLGPELGPVCASRPVRVIILDNTSGFSVVSLPEAGCQVVRFTVKDETVGVLTLVNR